MLITHGADDRIVKISALDQHKRGLPHAQVHRMANAGHAAFWEDAASFNQRLRAFAENL
jgi:pimeloyl-ACP methyl ester carboxylesterase